MNYSLTVLEYDKVLAILAGYIKTTPGLQELEKIQPLTDAQQIRQLLRMAEDTTLLIKTDISLFFEPIDDILPLLNASRTEGYILTPDAVMEIKKTILIFIDNYRSIKPYADKYPTLWELLSNAKIPYWLLNELERIFDEDGGIKDNASLELNQIRQRKKSLRNEIHKRLFQHLDSEQMKGGFSERIITIRDGRYVIPVKTAFKNRGNAIVHSFSKSGETAFVEPESVIGLNNQIMELDEKEQLEIRRILREITLDIRDLYDDLILITELVGKLEVNYAKACFANQFNCGFPKIVEQQTYIRLQQAFHPLLKKVQEVVPIDIEVGNEFKGLVISGPNAGGKTVALKTVGLLTLMALSGLPITAHSDSQIGLFHKVLAEIGDDQSITQNLSTFSGHIIQLSKILKDSDERSLVLIDEITSATEPREGEALGRMIIQAIMRKGACFIVTTHYQGIKEIAYSDERIRNAFVEFDQKRYQPTYRLHIGGTGNSYALQIARRYGIPEFVIRDAENYLAATDTDTVKALKEIEQEKSRIIIQQNELQHKIKQAEKIQLEYQKKVEELENEKLELKQKGISVLKQELDDALKQISLLKEELKRNKKQAHLMEESLRKADRITDQARDVLESSQAEVIGRQPVSPENLKIGRQVYVRPFDKTGTIEEIMNDRVKVRIGIISSIVDKDQIYSIESEEQPSPQSGYSVETSAMRFTLDLRGEHVEEALKKLEKNLDSAYIQGVKVFSIIHGKGEGILRKVIRDYLQTVDYVASYEYARPEEGGQGKTIITLK